MHTTRYTLETITPLFLRGPDGETPELRPPSFKGMLRYWWRALHPMPVDQLRKQEAKRFGSAGDRDGNQSSVRIRLLDRDLVEEDFQPVPTHNFRRRGYRPNQKFDLQISIDSRGESHRDEIDAVLRLMILLGGVGWRARRGMGSLRLVSVDGNPVESSTDALESVEAQIARLGTSFKRDGRTVTYVGPHADSGGPPYPWVQTIQTGLPREGGWESTVKEIAEVASRENSHYTGNHDDPRISSPLFVTVGCEEDMCWPLITSLNLPPSTEQRITDRRGDTRSAFREALL